MQEVILESVRNESLKATATLSGGIAVDQTVFGYLSENALAIGTLCTIISAIICGGCALFGLYFKWCAHRRNEKKINNFVEG